MCVMMLLDSRHPAKVDLEFMAWMGENQLPFVMVFTKVDKLNQAERAGFMRATRWKCSSNGTACHLCTSRVLKKAKGAKNCCGS